ncbi:MAG: ribonuclease HII [Lysobacterales bacterium]
MTAAPSAGSRFPIPGSPLLVAGVDEAGRGPLAGPVAVAAVILDPARPIAGLDDSKKLTERRRDALFPLIRERALAWRIEFVEADEIDALNILQATLTGMRRALQALAPAAGLALVDGNRLPKDLPCPARAIVGGDALEPAIMAASILAGNARSGGAAAAQCVPQRSTPRLPACGIWTSRAPAWPAPPAPTPRGCSASPSPIPTGSTPCDWLPYPAR